MTREGKEQASGLGLGSACDDSAAKIGGQSDDAVKAPGGGAAERTNPLLEPCNGAPFSPSETIQALPGVGESNPPS
jgi:hypothetical protein